jgi:hypothetical protein
MGPSNGPADADLTKPTVVAVGNSHLMTVWGVKYSADACTAPFRVVCLRCIVPQYVPLVTGEGNARRMNADFLSDVKTLIDVERPAAVLCFSSDSFGFAVGAFKSPRPFDFALPGRDDLELIPGAEIIPYGLMAEAALLANTYWSQMISVAVECGHAPVYSVCVPPPVASFEPFLPTLSNDSIRSKLERFGEAPKALRYKTWHVQAEADCRKAAAAGAGFLRPPAEALDDDGFLGADFAGDLIHANPAYGNLILRQLADAIVSFPGHSDTGHSHAGHLHPGHSYPGREN